MRLTLKSKNQNLAVAIFKPEDIKGPHPALIFVHGWQSNQQGNIKRSAEVSKLGFICLTLDLRGHGESDGKLEDFSRQDHLEDVKTAYDYLISLPEVDKERIGIIGSSYGAYLAAVALNFLKFKWLVLRVPALYFDKDMDVATDKLIKEDENAFKTSGLNPKNCLALKGVANFKGGILIVESEKDEEIPRSVIANYLEVIDEKNRLTYKIMKNTRHSLETGEQEEEYIEIITKFLSSSF